MHIRLFVPASLVLLGLVGCRAQEQQRALQNSVTRLEQRLNLLNEALRAKQGPPPGEQRPRESDHERVIQDLKRMVDEARDQAQRTVAEAKQREQANQRALDEARGRLAEFEQRANAQRQEMEMALRNAERQREQAARGGDERMAAIERLADERREIERLRAAVMADLARSKPQEPKPQDGKVEVAAERLKRLGDEMNQLRAENERLKKELAGRKPAAGDKMVFVDSDKDGLPDRVAPPQGMVRMQREASTPTPAKPAPQKWSGTSPMPMPPMPPMPAGAPKAMSLPLPGGGSVVIENENCEVHIHIHGDAATLKAAPKDGAAPPPKTKEAAPPATKTVRVRALEGGEAIEVVPSEGGEKAVRVRKSAPKPAEPIPPAEPQEQPRERPRAGGGEEPPTTRTEADDDALRAFVLDLIATA